MDDVEFCLPGHSRVRYRKIFEGAGPSLFLDDNYYNYVLGLLCSKLGLMIINTFNPTMNININDIANIPVKIDQTRKQNVEQIAEDSISFSRDDWDSYETSWISSGIRWCENYGRKI